MSKKLFEVVFVRTQSATIYVQADDSADVSQQIEEGLYDALDEQDWEDTEAFAGDAEVVTEVTSSNGSSVWSGGPDGKWENPV